MSSLLKTKAEILEGARMQIKEKVVLSEISKAKAKGESPEAMAIRAANDPSSSTSTLSIVAEVGPPLLLKSADPTLSGWLILDAAIRRVRHDTTRGQLPRFR